jgi:tetratricopeptide (TPR) repeat protein
VSLSHALEAALALVAITALVVFSRRRYMLVGWLWFLGVMVPMIGLVQVGVQAMADRYMYIPAIGLFVMVCWGAADLFEKWHVNRVAVGVISGAALIALAVASHQYIDYWKDNLALWTHTLQVTQNNFIAEDSVAEVLIRQGRIDEAAAHFQNAVSINPKDPVGNLNLGTYQQQKGNYSAAIDRYEAVPRFTQNPRLLALAFTNLGYAYYSVGRNDPARQSFDSALQQQPENPQALLGLGVIAHVSGDFPLAIDEYQKALRLQASDLGFLLLAQALDREGQTESASAARASAARVSRNIEAATAAAQRLLKP